MSDSTTVRALSEAISFSLTVQEYIQQNNKCMSNLDDVAEAIMKFLPEYPGVVITDILTFADGSTAALTTNGFRIKD
jgi:hypothetical protein